MVYFTSMTKTPQLVPSLCVVWEMVAGFHAKVNQSFCPFRLNLVLKYLLLKNRSVTIVWAIVTDTMGTVII